MVQFWFAAIALVIHASAVFGGEQTGGRPDSSDLSSAPVSGPQAYQGELPTSAMRAGSCFGLVRRSSAVLKLKMSGESWMNRSLTPLIETVSANLPGIRGCNLKNLQICEMDPNIPYPTRLLQAFGIEWKAQGEGASEIPKEGPVIIVANHRGMIDGPLIWDYVSQFRSDVKIMAGNNISALPGLKPHLLAVDNSDDPKKRTHSNIRALRAAVEYLNEGHALIWFPSDYMDYPRTPEGPLENTPWHNGVTFAADNTNARVMVLHLPYQAPKIVYDLGRISPILRTAAHPWALMKQRGQELEFFSAGMIPEELLTKFKDRESKTKFMEAFQRAFGKIVQARELSEKSKDAAQNQRSVEPLAPNIPKEHLEFDYQRLTETHRYGIPNGNVTAIFPGSEFKFFMDQLGRDREEVFRAEGEGSGKARDIDSLDQSYFQQLVVMDPISLQMRGGYRMGRGTRASQEEFHIEPGAMPPDNQILELGRAWVRTDFQGSFIQYLFSGIGHYVGRNPDITHFTGLVSISLGEPEPILQLLSAYQLQPQNLAPGAEKIRAHNPPNFSALSEEDVKTLLSSVSDVRDFNTLVTALDPQRKGLPPLIPAYQNLGARTLGVNVDPAFNSLDIAMIARMGDIPRPLRRRSMGPYFHSYNERHGLDQSTP